MTVFGVEAWLGVTASLAGWEMVGNRSQTMGLSPIYANAQRSLSWDGAPGMFSGQGKHWYSGWNGNPVECGQPMGFYHFRIQSLGGDQGGRGCLQVEWPSMSRIKQITYANNHLCLWKREKWFHWLIWIRMKRCISFPLQATSSLSLQPNQDLLAARK